MLNLLKMASFFLSLYSGFALSLEPYVGIETQIKYLAVEGISLKTIRTFNFQPHALIGVKFNDYLSLEAGAHHSEKYMDTYAYNMKGAHIDAISRIPFNESISIIGSLGMSVYNVRLSNRSTHAVSLDDGHSVEVTDTGYNPGTSAVTLGSTQPSWIGANATVKAIKFLPRLMIGSEVKLNNDFSLRSTIIWEQLSRVSGKNFKLQNSLNLGLGLIYWF